MALKVVARARYPAPMTRRSYTRVSDGAAVGDDEAVDHRGCLRAGYSMHFDMAFMDAASVGRPTTLRDAAGAPVTLHDARTGQSLRLNTNLIAAIEVEAGKLGMAVPAYVADVLRYAIVTPAEAR